MYLIKEIITNLNFCLTKFILSTNLFSNGHRPTGIEYAFLGTAVRIFYIHTTMCTVNLYYCFLSSGSLLSARTHVNSSQLNAGSRIPPSRVRPAHSIREFNKNNKEFSVAVFLNIEAFDNKSHTIIPRLTETLICSWISTMLHTVRELMPRKVHKKGYCCCSYRTL